MICSGLEAAVAGNSITCRLRLSVGSNAIQVQGIDFAGNVAMTTINVMYNLDPSPSALFLTPDHFALGMSETRTLGLVDDLGRVIPASGWAVSDATVAQVAVDGTITPVAAGTATVTGSYQGLSATAQLTVYGTPGLPPATVRWFVQPMPGNTLLKVYSGQAATPDDPNAYFVEQAAASVGAHHPADAGVGGEGPGQATCAAFVSESELRAGAIGAGGSTSLGKPNYGIPEQDEGAAATIPIPYGFRQS